MSDDTGIWDAADAPAIGLIRQRYREAGLFNWDNKRVKLLCTQIKCTPQELCATAGFFDINRVATMMKRATCWPVYLTIHFARLEHQIHRAKFIFEKKAGPGPEDIEMAKLIAKGAGLGANSPTGPAIPA